MRDLAVEMDDYPCRYRERASRPALPDAPAALTTRAAAIFRDGGLPNRIRTSFRLPRL